jgi:hypothetical protein
MNLLAIQGVVCLLISLWGLAMLVLGAVWANVTWAVLGLAVLIVGLPFVRTVFRSSRPSRRGAFPL